MIVDVNAWCGRWPFRRLAFAGAAGLVKLLERTGTDLALVSPISGAFYRDCLTAMEEMLEDAGWDERRMKPVAVVNPTFPGWQEDLEAMVRGMGCAAVRLISNYHGYTLYDEVALQVAKRVLDRGLPLVVTMRMQDERSHHWCMPVRPVAVEEVQFLMRQLPEATYVLSNIWYSEVRSLRRELEMVRQGAWEMSYKPPAFFVEQAVEEFGPERVLYGSGAPLQYPESLLLPVQEADVSQQAKELILGGNAARLFGLGG